MDDYSGECLAIEVDTSLSGLWVTRTLERLALSRGLPETIVVDNGPEFAVTVLDAWVLRHGVTWTSSILASPCKMPTSKLQPEAFARQLLNLKTSEDFLVEVLQ